MSLRAYEHVWGQLWRADKHNRVRAALSFDDVGSPEQLDRIDENNVLGTTSDSKLCLKVTDTFALDESNYRRSLGLFTCDLPISARARHRRVTLGASRQSNRFIYRTRDVITLYGGCQFACDAFEARASQSSEEVPGYNQQYVLGSSNWVQDGWAVQECIMKPSSLAQALAQQDLPVSQRSKFGYVTDLDMTDELRAQVIHTGVGCMINHDATNPNAKFVCIQAPEPNQFCMAIEALFDIPASTEITCNYGDAYFV